MQFLNFLKVVFLGSLFICSGCNGDVMKKCEIEEVISQNLKPGSNNQEIIKFFENHKWVYAFDRHVGRYQARNPEEDELPEIQGRNQIYIYVNERKEFVRAEVEKVFSGL